MKILAQIKYCNNIIKVLVKVPVTNMPLQPPMPTPLQPPSPIQPPSPLPRPLITKSVSYHNIHNNFNVEKYIEDEKKYIKKMNKYYNE